MIFYEDSDKIFLGNISSTACTNFMILIIRIKRFREIFLFNFLSIYMKLFKKFVYLFFCSRNFTLLKKNNDDILKIETELANIF